MEILMMPTRFVLAYTFGHVFGWQLSAYPDRALQDGDLILPLPEGPAVKAAFQRLTKN